MKKYLFIVLALYFGCEVEQSVPTSRNNDNNGNLISLHQPTKFRKDLDSLIREYIQQNNLKHIHGQIYIYRRSPQLSYVLLVSSPYVEDYHMNVTMNIGMALFRVKYDDCVFDIFSGWEDKIMLDSSIVPPAYMENRNQTVWQLVDSTGVFHHQPNHGLPFFPNIEMISTGKKTAK